jgi:hypothetical protein
VGNPVDPAGMSGSVHRAGKQASRSSLFRVPGLLPLGSVSPVAGKLSRSKPATDSDRRCCIASIGPMRAAARGTAEIVLLSRRATSNAVGDRHSRATRRLVIVRIRRRCSCIASLRTLERYRWHPTIWPLARGRPGFSANNSI